jgi:hypothetical protein
MRDYLPDELPAEDAPLEWDCEPWWWCELMSTSPLDEGGDEEQGEEEIETIYFTT